MSIAVLTGRILLGLLALVLLALAWLAWRFFSPISTPPFRDADGKPAAGSVAVNERWPINGTEQSVIIRGRHQTDPILIWVHGGPGSSETPVLRQFNAALEEHFVVVYWDQRYAGQSLDPFGPKPGKLTIQQYVDDLGVVVERLKARFHQDKVVLVAHSWGTIPAILYAQQKPQTVAAYVGIGQVADVQESEKRSLAFAMGEARARGNAKAVAELEAYAARPRTGMDIYTPRQWLAALGGSFHAKGMGQGSLVLIGVRSSEANWRDIAGFELGGKYAMGLTTGEMAKITFARAPFPIGVPVFLMSGRYDQQSEATVAREFFDRIEAPRKAFVWFEQSAHSPPFEEPDAFNRYMIEQVRPLALGQIASTQ
jgi:pimeloyl-ACP methyl ester carboxylesterase